MVMKYFIISDIHGHYNEMMAALKKSKYDSNDNQHHLIVIGDMFDRGEQSKEVLEYLYNLSEEGKASIILGNHETFLIELLDGNFLSAYFNIKHNGTLKTLVSLLDEDLKPNVELYRVKKNIENKYPYLKSWLKSLPLYLEIGNYIFVHGGIDGDNDEWKKGLPNDFIWSRQNNLSPIANKTIVVGHTRIATIRYPGMNYKELFISKPEAFDILYDEGKIFIDAFAEISKKINVLILEI